MKYASADELHRMGCRLLQQRGVNAAHAHTVMDVLVTTSLRGIDTHGIRLLPFYLRMLDSGKCNARPMISFTPLRAGAHKVDADFALGPVAALAAAERLVSIGQGVGCAAVAVCRANHFGAAGYYAATIAASNMIGMVFSNSDALVAPYNGKSTVFGTNPIALAAPGQNEELFLLDMATSQVSFSQIVMRRTENQPLDTGWAIDDSGNATTDPTRATRLTPLGGYKGHGLAMAVEILCALLTDSAFDHELISVLSPEIDANRQTPAYLMVGLDIGCFTDVYRFKHRLSSLMAHVRATPSRVDEIIINPGDKETSHQHQRRLLGIPMDEASWEALTLLDREPALERDNT